MINLLEKEIFCSAYSVQRTFQINDLSTVQIHRDMV